MNRLEKLILKTLNYFDDQQRPLILEEVWRFLYKLKVTRVKVLITLQKLADQGEIKYLEPYYYLEQKTFNKHLQNQESYQNKIKKANFYINLLKNLPFVRVILITNALKLENKQNSNVELLIVGQRKRLKLVKVLTEIALDLLGQKKNRWYKKDKIEIKYLISEDVLKTTRKDLKEYELAIWIGQFIPCFDKGFYQKLIQANNIEKKLPNYQAQNIKINREKAGIIEKFLKNI